MPEHRYRILSTKDIEAELIEAAAVEGIDIEVKQFIQIQPIISNVLQQKVKALYGQEAQVIFTSANAVNAVEILVYDRPRNFYYGDYRTYPPGKASDFGFGPPGFHTYLSPVWNIYCLAGRTKETVKKLLPEVKIAGTASNARALAEQIVQAGNISSVVFFCGNKRRDELPAILRAQGITVEEIIVYETLEVPVVAEKDYDGVFFLSPSAVKSFFSVNRLQKHTVCFVIGYTTAKMLEDFTDNRIVVSTAPSMRDMVHTAVFYFNNLNIYE